MRKTKLEQRTLFDIVDEWILGFPGQGGQNPTQERDVWAVFGHAEYEITDQLKLIGGLRYTEETRKQTNQGTFMYGDLNNYIAYVFCIYYAGLACPGATPTTRGDILTNTVVGLPAPADGWTNEISSNDWSGKIGVNYDLNDDWMLYGSIARGTKSGGFADNAQSVVEGLAPYDVEKLLAYEVGAKGTTLDGTLRLNSAIFFYDYEDQQVSDSIVDPVYANLVGQVNAPKSEMYGFEVEALWNPIEGLTIGQNIGYTKGEFKEFNSVDEAAVLAGGAPFMPVFEVLDGEDIGFPEWQYSGLISYEMPLSNSNLMARFAVDYSYESETLGNDELVNQVPLATGPYSATSVSGELDDYWLVNARVSLISEDSWEVTLFGNNVLDEEYETSRGFFDHVNVVSVGMPRTYGIRVKADF